MNWDRLEENWRQAMDPAEEKWANLADDDLTVIAGKRDELIGLLQERYGIARAQAEKFTEEWRRMAAVALSRMH